MKKKLFFINLIFIFFIIFVLQNQTCYAYPKLVSKLVNGFEQIKTWLVKIATPAAAVAVRYRNIYEKI